METLVLISRCCGKGSLPAKFLHKELQAAGMSVKYEKVRPNQAEGILNRYGIPLNTMEPFVYICDLLIPADKLKDANYRITIINQLKPSFLNSIEKK